MPIIEILAHVVALDIGWLINFVISNPFWVFGFGAVAYFMYNKRPIFAGTLVALYVHTLVDTTAFLGWTFGSGLIFAPIIVFFGQTIFDSFVGKTKYAVHRTIFTIIIFYVFMVGYNLFVV